MLDPFLRTEVLVENCRLNDKRKLTKAFGYEKLSIRVLSAVTPRRSYFSMLVVAKASVGIFASGGAIVCLCTPPVYAQKPDPKAEPIVVQPGAPGQPSRTLPSSARAKLPLSSKKDVEFMQGMIMHHAQAVEIAALIESRTQNEKLLLLGARISQSQSDEMNFMKRWLALRGEPISQPMPEVMTNHQMSDHHPLMPGMLTPKQMDALKKAKGAEFDRLFLTGMIQHHNGALVMVKDLFDTPAAGQDAELFNFVTDVDSGQRAEIRIMQTMLDETP
jgi:uncharacterized protein (DUF305 family)